MKRYTRNHVITRVGPVAVLALMLAGCSSAGSGSAGPSQAPGVGGGASPASRSTTAPATTASGTGFSPAVQKVINAAAAEGELTLNWGSGNMAKTTPILFKDFNKYYGLNLKLSLTPQSNINKNQSQLEQEFKAGKPASTDAFWGVPQHLIGLNNAGILDSDPGWSVWGTNITPKMLDGFPGQGKIGVVIDTLIGGLVYNTNMIKPADVPKTPQDVIDLESKMPVASTPYAAFFSNLAAPGLLGLDATEQFLDKFAPKVKGLIGCGDLDRVASGEFGALFIACSQASYLELEAKGAPIGFAPIQGMSVGQDTYIAFPKNAAHPNAAHLWANYLMTPEAQQIMYKMNYADSIEVPNSQTAKQIAEYNAAGADFVITSIPDELKVPSAFLTKVVKYFAK